MQHLRRAGLGGWIVLKLGLSLDELRRLSEGEMIVQDVEDQHQRTKVAVVVREVPATDLALWTRQRVFGVAGGPDEIVLSAEGRTRAFAVGAQVRRGVTAEALEALAVAGGVALLVEHQGAKIVKTRLGMYDQVAWGYLKSLGYVETFGADGVALTDAGRRAVDDGYAERESLLRRCQEAAVNQP